jgi:hypothetical protein
MNRHERRRRFKLGQEHVREYVEHLPEADLGQALSTTAGSSMWSIITMMLMPYMKVSVSRWVIAGIVVRISS